MISCLFAQKLPVGHPFFAFEVLYLKAPDLDASKRQGV